MRKMWWILSFILIVAGLALCTALNTLPKFIELIAVSAAMIFVAIYINKKVSNLFLKIIASLLICYLLAVVVADISASFLVPKYLYCRNQVVISLLVKAIPSFFTFLGNLIMFVLCITNKSRANNKSE